MRQEMRLSVLHHLDAVLDGAQEPVGVSELGRRIVIETAGRFKEGDADGTVWTAQEIAEHWDAIVKG